MSWDYNPYKGFEVRLKNDNFFHLYCHNCGTQFPNVVFREDNTISDLMRIWINHVRSSHKLKPEDTEKWS